MKYLFTILVAHSLLYSCNQKSELALFFNCNKDYEISDLKTLNDINKNYTVTYPSHWKSSLYFDDYQSDIYLADTTKSLTSTYILNISNKKGTFIVNEDFKTNNNATLKALGLAIINEKVLKNKDIQYYYIYAKGNRNQLPYHQIQLYKPLNSSEFFDIKIEIYGNQQLEERICDAIYFVELLKVS